MIHNNLYIKTFHWICMTIHFNKTGLLLSCIALSVLAHILSFYAWRLFGTYDFTSPVNKSQSVVVELAKPTDAASPVVNPEVQDNRDFDQAAKEEIVENNSAPTSEESYSTSTSNTEQRMPFPEAAVPVAKLHASTQIIKAASVTSPLKSRQQIEPDPIFTPLSIVGKFMTTKNEKLTYLISMFGIPVGSAELEAKNENGEIWLTLRVKSNAAISSIFPVDNIVETRHIGGRFIMTKIRQHEGSFRSDELFTINLSKKRVSWIDNIGGRSLTMTVPTDEVLDTLSGIYYLRNRQLEIGKTEILQIYDSEIFADVQIEILRREIIRLPNLEKVDTLVVRPLQKTAGIFRRTGDILIWMTDNTLKVPVKIVTSVALGKVTIELVSAESIPQEAETAISK
jgi:hypothetical protein